MSLIKYTKNKSTIAEITQHLNRCNDLFRPKLSSYVDISAYSEKIHINSYSFEAWDNNELVGIVACYLNNHEGKEGYITNVSVLKEYHSNNIAQQLLEQTILTATNKCFKKLILEVQVDNAKAISLYMRKGFNLSNRIGNKYLMEKRLNEHEIIKVSICCLTYNHENYISNTIEGFLMQKRTFPIEILIHDDASADGTADIIKKYEIKYPDIIKPIYQKENQYSKGIAISSVYQVPRARGRYIALCEGDDYWTDPYKLQMQVDFMEANPQYDMVSSDVELIDEKGNPLPDNNMLIKQREKYEPVIGFFNLMETNKINTLTVCVRTFIMKQLGERIQKENLWYTLDYWFWLHISINSKIWISNEKTAAYRIHGEGVSHKKGILDGRIPWVRYDAAKQYVKETKSISGIEKIQLFKVMVGVAFKTNTFSKLWFFIVYWIITHPGFIAAWVVSKFKCLRS